MSAAFRIDDAAPPCAATVRSVNMLNLSTDSVMGEPMPGEVGECGGRATSLAVSYTYLTLPTNREV